MRTSHKGFTLAELLIALALLGIIAAFTIPKVLQAAGSQEATAKVREAVSTLEQAWYNLKMQNIYIAGSDLYSNFTANTNNNAAGLNVLQNAPGTTSAASAPYNGLAVAHPCAAFTGWLQFQNGVVISGLVSALVIPPDLNTNSTNYIICIDYNGASMPNTAGQDVFYGNFNSSGNFDAAGAGFTAGTNSRNFFWGTATQAVFDAAGTGTTSTVAAGAGSMMD
jgi:prepilin-type N-terminal cleavage/methylation domain-containing protein